MECNNHAEKDGLNSEGICDVLTNRSSENTVCKS